MVNEGVKKPQDGFTVSGQVKMDVGEASRDLKLKAFVFDPGGRFLGSGNVDARGNFSTLVLLAEPSPVDVLFGPPEDPEIVRHASSPRLRFTEKDWLGNDGRFLLKADIELGPEVLEIFRPLRICVSGHIRKVVHQNGRSAECPVPYLKVEVFDVDREGCWWPYLLEWLPKISDRRVLRIPDLLKAARVKPRPARAISGSARIERVEPAGIFSSEGRVGEMKYLSPEVASRLEKLTLTSILAPWFYFPRCYYSRTLVCETYTDRDGYFNCCFPWWIHSFPNGRLRVDMRPDIILRVTQIVDGVETVVYMDPYTSTRWNSTSTHIDLLLDNEAIVCGSANGNPPPGTNTAAILQIGADEVWKVDQANGTYKTTEDSNGAYQGKLFLRGNFTADLLAGSPRRYYKLSWASERSTRFTPIRTPLEAKRAAPGGRFESYVLGPQPTDSPFADLYEVQDTAHWWIVEGSPIGQGMVIGIWDTSFVEDEGTYVVRLEVFDEAGRKITTTQFANHGGDGTGVEPSPVPTVTDHLDLKFHIDSMPVVFDVTVPEANECGVIPCSSPRAIPLDVHTAQENGRVHSWSLHYTKGVDPTRIALDDDVDHDGGDSRTVRADTSVLEDEAALIEGTCAFALILGAKSHVRGNDGFIWLGEKVKAIAIEKCP